MNGYLLDTNILSELRKGARAHPAVRRWAAGTAREIHKVSVLSLGEIRKDIDILQRRSPQQARVLNSWLDRLRTNYADDLLPIESQIVDRWGRLEATRSLAVIDGLLAATALVHDLVLATRNTRDFTDTGVSLVNPFDHSPI